MSAHDKIRVVVRVRPRERPDSPTAWQYDQQRMVLSRPGGGGGTGTTAFALDHVFGETATNADVYKDFAQPIALSVLNGINGLFLL